MGQCAFCKANAEQPESAELAICAKCSSEHEARGARQVSAQEIRFALIQNLVDATLREKAASDGVVPRLDSPSRRHLLRSSLKYALPGLT